MAPLVIHRNLQSSNYRLAKRDFGEAAYLSERAFPMTTSNVIKLMLEWTRYGVLMTEVRLDRTATVKDVREAIRAFYYSPVSDADWLRLEEDFAAHPKQDLCGRIQKSLKKHAKKKEVTYREILGKQFVEGVSPDHELEDTCYLDFST